MIQNRRPVRRGLTAAVAGDVIFVSSGG